MKKYLFSLLMCLPAILVNAQTGELVIQGSKPISAKQTPQQVMDSLHARFPNAEAVKIYQEKGADAANGWEVTKSDDIGLDGQVDYYTISFKNHGMQYYGLYDPHGKLIESKGQAKIEDLPKPVADAYHNIAKTRPGWVVVSKTGFRQRNYDTKKEYYEVVAEKGGAQKLLTFSPEGKLLKVQDKKK
jgi:hypothetical protein